MLRPLECIIINRLLMGRYYFYFIFFTIRMFDLYFSNETANDCNNNNNNNTLYYYYYIRLYINNYAIAVVCKIKNHVQCTIS